MYFINHSIRLYIKTNGQQGKFYRSVFEKKTSMQLFILEINKGNRKSDKRIDEGREIDVGLVWAISLHLDTCHKCLSV